MHKGPQPISGHYTALRKASYSFILIDNEHVQKYPDNTLNKDGYLYLFFSENIRLILYLHDLLQMYMLHLNSIC